MNEQLLARLDEAGLDPEVEILVMAAALGEAELADAIGGGAPVRPEPDAVGAVDAPYLYLADITVEGFRGVGPATTLGLQPGCGLTLVVGRNGSGKSSFAEAAELSLTGNNQRWDAKSKVWKDGWRNLHHHSGRRIAVRLQVDGQEGFTRVESRWAEGADLEQRSDVAQVGGSGEVPLASLGLSPAFETWRPFLSYDDLGSLLSTTPSSIYDRLSVLLGLEDWVDVEKRLKEQAKRVAGIVKAADASAKAIRATLQGFDDERAVRALAALPVKGPWDLDDLDALATGTAEPDPDLVKLHDLANLVTPDPDLVRGVVESLRTAAVAVQGHEGTSAQDARNLADLLERAITFQAGHREDETCSVCGTEDVLTDAWMRTAIDKVETLRAAASEVTNADDALRHAAAHGRQLLSVPPEALVHPPVGVDTTELLAAWQAWATFEIDPGGDEAHDGWPTAMSPLGCLALADHLEARQAPLTDLVGAVVDAAQAERAQRQDRWRPVAEHIAAWLDGARQAQAERGRSKALKEAGEWVAAEAVRVRSERFVPIAAQVKEVWDELRHDSNVTIDDLALDGANTRRRLAMSVSVDDASAAGMSVLSQGELHALSLALFLPRATQDASPFRFVVIDDPVQALDAARVDGLARVLQRVAETRQVIVFTHDERLPDACRRLAIAARVLEVSRGVRSALTVRAMASPSQRYLDDARAIASSNPYPIEARRRVVPGLCRQALEAASVDLGRRKLFANGVGFTTIEDQVAALGSLVSHLAFGLFGDSDKGNEVYARLNGLAPKHRPVDLVKQLNKGTHELVAADPHQVVDDTESLVQILRDKA